MVTSDSFPLTLCNMYPYGATSFLAAGAGFSGLGVGAGIQHALMQPIPLLRPTLLLFLPPLSTYPWNACHPPVPHCASLPAPSSAGHDLDRLGRHGPLESVQAQVK